MEQFYSAIRDFKRAIRLDVACAQAVWRRGHIYRKVRDDNRVLNSFSKAIDLVEPENAAFLYSRAVLLENQNYRQLAIADLDEVIRIKPDHRKAIRRRKRIQSRNE